jgi:hypothetical protein
LVGFDRCGPDHEEHFGMATELAKCHVSPALSIHSKFQLGACGPKSTDAGRVDLISSGSACAHSNSVDRHTHLFHFHLSELTAWFLAHSMIGQLYIVHAKSLHTYEILAD